MNLPGWFRQAEEKNKQKKLAYNAYAQSLVHERKVRDSASKAPGWRDLGQEISCIPDAIYPWDRDVLRAIREFDPGVVPIWVRWMFQHEDGEIIKIGRHGIARRLPKSPTGMSHEELKISGYESFGAQPKPHLIEFIWQGEKDKRGSDLPGAYKPFDWSLYYWMRSNYQTKSAKQLVQEVVHNPHERSLKEKAKRDEEHDYIKADLEKYVTNKLAQVSEVEMKEHLLGDKTKSSKPIVTVGDITKGLPLGETK